MGTVFMVLVCSVKGLYRVGVQRLEVGVGGLEFSLRPQCLL